jgi:hypothetical protein
LVLQGDGETLRARVAALQKDVDKSSLVADLAVPAARPPRPSEAHLGVATPLEKVKEVFATPET